MRLKALAVAHIVLISMNLLDTDVSSDEWLSNLSDSAWGWGGNSASNAQDKCVRWREQK